MWTNRGLIEGYIPSRFSITKYKTTYVMTTMWSRDCWVSADGILWSRYIDVMANGPRWFGIAASDKTIISMSYSNTLFSISKDGGASWYLQVTPFETVGWTVAYIRGAFYAFTVDGYMSKSYDECVTWTTAVQIGVETPSVSYSDDIIFIGSGTIYSYSKDEGATWIHNNTSTIAGKSCWNGAWFVTAYTGNIANVILKSNVNGTTTLQSIVSAECLQSNFITVDDIDVTQLSQNVRGYVLSSVAAIRSGLAPLQGAFQFDTIQAGYKIVFKPRGGSSVTIIPANDLGAVNIS